MLNAMGKNLTQHTFFTDDTDAVRSRFQVTFGGMSLPDLAGLLEAHGTEVAFRHAEATTVDEFRTDLETNLGQHGDFMIANYEREALGQGRMGHISPLAAYDRDTDKVLILDTAGYKYPPTWVPVELLFSAMSTTDTSTGKTRGFAEVSRAAGAGGVATISTGLWTGEGDEGPGAPWTICFSVNEAGDALTADPVECQSFAIQVNLAGCPDSIWWRPDIPIVEGSFSLTEPGDYDIQGTFDGDLASGEATFTIGGVDCTGPWQASPSM